MKKLLSSSDKQKDFVRAVSSTCPFYKYIFVWICHIYRLCKKWHSPAWKRVLHKYLLKYREFPHRLEIFSERKADSLESIFHICVSFIKCSALPVIQMAKLPVLCLYKVKKFSNCYVSFFVISVRSFSFFRLLRHLLNHFSRIEVS